MDVQNLWKLLSKLKLTLSYSKTRELLQSCSKIDIPKQLSWTTDKIIGVIGADNCAYYNNHHFERDIQEVKFINTVNWYHRYLDKPLRSTYSVEDNILQEFEPDVAAEFWYVQVSRSLIRSEVGMSPKGTNVGSVLHTYVSI
jgi:hypothetical protein